MKAISQVCTPAQAIKLSKLGIEAPSLFGWIIPPANGMGGVEAYAKQGEYRLILADTILFVGNGSQAWRAYNVAEMGEMLPADCVTHKCSDRYDLEQGEFFVLCQVIGQLPRAYGATEAQARAEMLIKLNS